MLKPRAPRFTGQSGQMHPSHSRYHGWTNVPLNPEFSQDWETLDAYSEDRAVPSKVMNIKPSIDELYRKIEDLQKENMAQRTTIHQQHIERMELQNQLEIALNKLSLSAEAQEPVAESLKTLLDEAKPYVRQLVLLYNPTIEESKLRLGARPSADTLSRRFHPDHAQRPSSNDVTLAELYDCLPVRFHHLVLEEEFANMFTHTVNNIKSTVVSNTRKAMVSIVGVDNKYARAATNRKECPEITSLLSWQNKPGVIDLRPPFLYPTHIQERIRLQNGSQKGYMARIFQQPMIFQLIKANLFGASSIHDGKTSGAPAYASRWKLKKLEQFPLTVIPAFTLLFIVALSHFSSFSAAPDDAIPRKGWKAYFEFLVGELQTLQESKQLHHQYNKIITMFRDIVFDGKADSDGEDFQEELDCIDDEEGALLDDTEAASLCGSELSGREDLDDGGDFNEYLFSDRSRAQHSPPSEQLQRLTMMQRLTPSPPVETSHPLPPQTPPPRTSRVTPAVPPATPVTYFPGTPILSQASMVSPGSIVPDKPQGASSKHNHDELEPVVVHHEPRKGSQYKKGQHAASETRVLDAELLRSNPLLSHPSAPATIPQPDFGKGTRGRKKTPAIIAPEPPTAAATGLLTADSEITTLPTNPEPMRRRGRQSKKTGSADKPPVDNPAVTMAVQATVQQPPRRRRGRKKTSQLPSEPPTMNLVSTSSEVQEKATGGVIKSVHFSDNIEIHEISPRKEPGTSEQTDDPDASKDVAAPDTDHELLSDSADEGPPGAGNWAAYKKAQTSRVLRSKSVEHRHLGIAMR
ncbi:hypothetical protein H0H92_005349 [Tricholoma furcatifolium]|nr:hypothetical protein H0H92_005349 [Tricholoma furcatifolium]